MAPPPVPFREGASQCLLAGCYGVQDNREIGYRFGQVDIRIGLAAPMEFRWSAEPMQARPVCLYQLASRLSI